MLKELPKLVYPITPSQVNTLMEGVVQLNLINGGLNVNQQRALGILFDAFEIYAKSMGRVNYTGPEGHKRLFQDAMALAGPGTCLATRHGDLAAAHLAIDWNNATKRLVEAGMSPLTGDVGKLLELCRDLVPIPRQTDDSLGIVLRYAQAK